MRDKKRKLEELEASQTHIHSPVNTYGLNPPSPGLTPPPSTGVEREKGIPGEG